jgi:hypothetical protein
MAIQDAHGFDGQSHASVENSFNRKRSSQPSDTAKESKAKQAKGSVSEQPAVAFDVDGPLFL